MQSFLFSVWKSFFKGVEKESCLISQGYKALQVTQLFSFFSPLLNSIIEAYKI
jgi:hypothetical protein